MAFVVEDGSGKADANSYSSVADADAYFSLRGNSAWAALNTAAKEAALVLATDYIEATYRSAWLGYRISATQALSWPRSSVEIDGFIVPANVVPAAVANACIELAVRASAESLIVDLGQQVVREKVDVLEVEYSKNSDATKRYPVASRLLNPYLLSTATDGGAVITKVIRT